MVNNEIIIIIIIIIITIIIFRIIMWLKVESNIWPSKMLISWLTLHFDFVSRDKEKSLFSYKKM